MIKEMSYAEKLQILDPWISSIIHDIKKDLRNEHLKNDWRFSKKYFGSKNISKLTAEELTEGYKNALEQEEGSEQLAEYIANRWLLKHSDLYHLFEEELRLINPNFSDIVQIDNQKASHIIEKAVTQFNALNTYIFSTINSVVFSPEIYDQLKKRAQNEVRHHTEQSEIAQANQSIAQVHASYQQEIARLTDKYEKKISGLQKKYLTDMESYKKQITNLQRKLNGQ